MFPSPVNAFACALACALFLSLTVFLSRLSPLLVKDLTTFESLRLGKALMLLCKLSCSVIYSTKAQKLGYCVTCFGPQWK